MPRKTPALEWTTLHCFGGVCNPQSCEYTSVKTPRWSTFICNNLNAMPSMTSPPICFEVAHAARFDVNWSSAGQRKERYQLVASYKEAGAGISMLTSATPNGG